MVDNDSFFEIAEFAGYGKYEEFGGCPCGGVVAGIARINKKLCLIIANDSTVKSGAWFPTTAKKNLRVQNFKKWLSLWEKAKDRRIGKYAFKYPLPTYKNNKRDLSNLV